MKKHSDHIRDLFDGNEKGIPVLSVVGNLNDDYEGGETNFSDLEMRVKAKPGQALLFQHLLTHEGCEVTSGTKLVLRSDIMYRASAGS